MFLRVCYFSSSAHSIVLLRGDVAFCTCRKGEAFSLAYASLGEFSIGVFSVVSGPLMLFIVFSGLFCGAYSRCLGWVLMSFLRFFRK